MAFAWHDEEAVPWGSRRELLCEYRIKIRKHNPLKALEFMESLSNDGTDATDSDNHSICHK
jgi:hypothetical protein